MQAVFYPIAKMHINVEGRIIQGDPFNGIGIDINFDAI